MLAKGGRRVILGRGRVRGAGDGDGGRDGGRAQGPGSVTSPAHGP